MFLAEITMGKKLFFCIFFDFHGLWFLEHEVSEGG